MWGLIFTVGAFIVLALFPAVRCAVLHPLHVLWYGALDTFGYIRRKQYNLCHTGDLDIYCGYFGSGKTLSLVHKVTGLYEHYDGKTVWCPRRKKFVTQRVLILSNVALTVPYEPLRSLAQVVAASKVNQDYDDEHDTLTITIACVDELGVQLNSRSFRDNIDPTFLSTLLCCRHYYISLYGSAQRFGHVDKLMRDVTLSGCGWRGIIGPLTAVRASISGYDARGGRSGPGSCRGRGRSRSGCGPRKSADG